jgi:hypothetical protein
LRSGSVFLGIEPEFAVAGVPFALGVHWSEQNVRDGTLKVLSLGTTSKSNADKLFAPLTGSDV